jgi:hypothetical protein
MGCQREPFPDLRFIGISSRTEQWPLLDPGQHIVAVRAPKDTTGTWKLYFEHVSAVCVDQGLIGAGKPATAKTCDFGEDFTPTCGTDPRQDISFLTVKCPNIPVRLAACAITRDPPSGPALSARWGSMQFDPEFKRCVRVPGPPGDPPPPEQCAAAPAGSVCETSAMLDFDPPLPGLVTVFADSQSGCGDVRVTLFGAQTPTITTGR